MSLLDELEGFYVFIKHAETGGDLYDGIKNYQAFVLGNWPKDMPDNGNWLSELDSIVEKLNSTKEHKSVKTSSNLSSFRQDAQEAVHAINGKFEYYYSK